MKKIRCTIEEDGSVTIETTGFKGKSCLQATAEFEKALGTVKKQKRSPEYYQQETTATHIKAGK